MVAELASVQARVAKGIEWLTAHDPTGAFDLWFKSGIGPNDAKPAQAPERIEAYREYHAARVLFERLWTEMERLEKAAAK